MTARDDTYWILDRAQILCLASARRMELLDRLAAEGPLSAAQLAARCGAKPTAVYHHLQKLVAVGLVLEERDGDERGAVYRTPAPRMRLKRALADPAFRDLMVRCVAAVTRQAARDFEHGLELPAARADGDDRTLGVFRIVASPDAEQLARLNAALDEIAELLWTARGGDVPITLTWTLSPLDRGGDADESAD